MRAYVTLLATDNFLAGTLTLWQSLLDVNSEYPLVVVITDNLSENTLLALSKRNIKTYQFPFITYSKETIQFMDGNWSGHLVNTANKLNIFRLTDYEKIVYLDSDMLVIKNVDWLFERPHGSAVMDAGAIYDKYSVALRFCLPREYYFNFNSGLLVLEPSSESYNKVMEIFNRTLGYDQEIIRELWSNWKNDEELHLPAGVNTLVFYLPFYLLDDLINLTDISILHFIGQKPFMNDKIDLFSFIGLCEKRYLETLDKATNGFDKKEGLRNKKPTFVIPRTGFSYPKFKSIVSNYLKHQFPKGATALDVGCGRGVYGELLEKHFIMDGLDIYSLHNNEYTKLLYNNIIIDDIRNYQYDYYDLIIMGDVIEHLSVDDAKMVIDYAKKHCSMLLVAIPYQLKQDGNENSAEQHIQDDLTHELFMERYADFWTFCNDEKHGYYLWKKD